MPLILVAPLLKMGLAALGAGAAIGLVAREVRRLTKEWERSRTNSELDAASRRGMPTLRRDPQTGHWRVM